ncbi:MAG: sigma-70 family RNA polymerase sigma factor [Defluviitaleaceae bacterium]|nr:sigma-70 family RNA polymerase sigma factor [Defluviitaleaceae bacterium]MCL2262014.1 sigma-70 family RNA polymerase sigma factor [Defluviitaleaceae bacterium]
MLHMYVAMLDSEEQRFTFESFYQEVSRDCMNVALSVTKNHAMAEDALHDAFMYILEKQKEKFFAMSFAHRKSYTILTVKHRAINLLNYENHKNYLEEEQEPAVDFDLCAILENEEGYKYLIDCISSLPDIYKAVFEMRYILDMSNLEISIFLGITNKAVSTRIARAKLMLLEMGVANGQPITC